MKHRHESVYGTPSREDHRGALLFYRIVITGTLPEIGQAEAMAQYLSGREIRLFRREKGDRIFRRFPPKKQATLTFWVITQTIDVGLEETRVREPSPHLWSPLESCGTIVSTTW